jgi:hypothetical protein
MLRDFDFLINYFTPDFRYIAIIVVGVLIIVVIGMAWGNYQDQQAAQFKENNPDVATIWLVGERHNRVWIEKVDGEKPYQEKNGVYILPGDHVLSLDHARREEDDRFFRGNSRSKYRTTHFRTQMRVSLVAREQYTLMFGAAPGLYSLAEERPL